MTSSVGDTLAWSLTEPASGSWWANHRLYCYSTSSTKDVWTRADPDGSGGWQAPSANSGVTAGIAYNKSTQTWTDENTSAGEEPHNPVGYDSLSPTGTVNNTNPEFVRIQITSGSTVQRVWITSPYYSSGGGGGTSTEGVAVESGSLTLVNGDVVYVVDSTSITHTYYLKIDGLFAGGSHSNWQHTSGTQSGGTFSNAQDGKYTLEYEESVFPFNHVKIAELTVGLKKVFCNFW